MLDRLSGNSVCLKSVHLSARRGKQCRAIPVLDVVGGFAGR